MLHIEIYLLKRFTHLIQKLDSHQRSFEKHKKSDSINKKKLSLLDSREGDNNKHSHCATSVMNNNKRERERK